MNESALAYLAPIIAACLAISLGCFATVAWHNRRWPAPQSYRTKYGKVPPR